jgi:hypothetical protein
LGRQRQVTETFGLPGRRFRLWDHPPDSSNN